ncbi:MULTISPECIES: SGNH/GDSL hydrolase family protein [unclassified Pseudomonas]|uniref:SGNH/GDSL hydrolase family protein n=1 Tax=unclassified Pseudomonas TaxID=196821 RepID=UPI00131E8F30|nr:MULTISPECIES: SGNH/GDSL hydrolase family protein [unclassified Pseudomonas]
MAASLLTGLTILMIGDSHLATPDYLIGTLQDSLVQQGAKVHTLGICGTNAGDWLKVTPGTCGGAERRNGDKAVVLGGKAATQPISELIATDKPDLVLIVMGDTMASYTNPSFPKTWVWQQTTSLTKAIGATKTHCAWVGPTWGTEGGKYGKTFERVKLMSGFLASNVAPCSYIDSLSFAKPGQWATIDGQHLTGPGYKSWSSAIVDALNKLPADKLKGAAQ